MADSNTNTQVKSENANRTEPSLRPAAVPGSYKVLIMLAHIIAFAAAIIDLSCSKL